MRGSGFAAIALAACGLAATAAVPQPKPPILDDAAYSHPQRLVDVGGRRINLYCRGRGGPTVVLDSGLSDPTLVWGAVQPALSRDLRVCAYDRAGIGFSDPSGRAGDSRNIVGDLRALLRAAGVPPPYVLVGHSYGGLNVRLFAYEHSAEVAGLVLIDPAHEDADARYTAADPTWAASNARRLTRDRACAARVPPEGFAEGSEGFATCVVPAEAWFSPRLNAVRRRLEARRSFQLAQVLEVESLTLGVSDAQVRAARRPLGARPLIVLSSLEAPAPDATGTTAAHDRVQWALHEDLIADSVRGEHEGVARTGHYIQLDRPEIVVDAVRRVVRTARLARGPG
ncbi:alpha/beta hydrolase [Phenylobacterium sp.]|uniref:alpha/beta hydrolase n=1 Tax=Phenylobacterium sp. TaxID=1871053 RepID=UPI003567C354